MVKQFPPINLCIVERKNLSSHLVSEKEINEKWDTGKQISKFITNINKSVTLDNVFGTRFANI